MDGCWVRVTEEKGQNTLCRIVKKINTPLCRPLCLHKHPAFFVETRKRPCGIPLVILLLQKTYWNLVRFMRHTYPKHLETAIRPQPRHIRNHINKLTRIPLCPHENVWMINHLFKTQFPFSVTSVQPGLPFGGFLSASPGWWSQLSPQWPCNNIL